jgi:hypothetical protein
LADADEGDDKDKGWTTAKSKKTARKRKPEPESTANSTRVNSPRVSESSPGSHKLAKNAYKGLGKTPQAAASETTNQVRKVVAAPSSKSIVRTQPSRNPKTTKNGKVCIINQEFTVENVYTRTLAKEWAYGQPTRRRRCDN